MAAVGLSSTMLASLLLKTLGIVVFVPMDCLLLVSVYRVKTLHNNPIFLLSRTQILFDILALITEIIYDVPSTIAEKKIFGERWSNETF